MLSMFQGNLELKQVGKDFELSSLVEMGEFCNIIKEIEEG